MIPVPIPVLKSLATTFKIDFNKLRKFGGGDESSDGIVYEFLHENQRRLLKIMAFPAADQQDRLFCLQERMHFARYLGEHGVNIAFPLPTPNDNLYETFPFEDHVWVGYTMKRIPGRTKSGSAWNPDFFRTWGRTIGMCHRLTKEYPSWQSSIDPETGKEHLTWRSEWQSFYDWCQDEEVKKKWQGIRQELEKLPVTRDAFGFIHNDPHIWNLLVNGNHITLLDFDVANHHWFITDISIACQHILIFLSGGLNRPLQKRDRLLNFLKLLTEGYQQENELSPEWLNRLDLFYAYRRIMMFIVMNDEIRSNPSRQRSLKNMILSQPEILGKWV